MIEINISTPPSINHAYYNVPGKGRRLTSEAKEFKNEVTIMTRNAIALAGWESDPKSIYGLIILFRTSRTNRDVSNVIKLTEDAIFDALLTSDSKNHLVVARKIVSKDEGCTVYFGHEIEIINHLPDLLEEI
jgi:Holliday junction resolvase RusA-like endonuclease